MNARRRAIRMPDGRLLAVPPMPAGLSSPVRVKVFEAVLTGNIGLAMELIDSEVTVRLQREEHVPESYLEAVRAAFAAPDDTPVDGLADRLRAALGEGSAA